MRTPLPLLSLCLALAAPLSAQKFGEQPLKAFTPVPCFDYTALRLPDNVWFQRIEAGQFKAKDAVQAATGDRDDVRAAGVKFVMGDRDYYLVETFRRLGQGSYERTTSRFAADDGSVLPLDGLGDELCFDYGDPSAASVGDELFKANVLLGDSIVVSFNSNKARCAAYEVMFYTKVAQQRWEAEIVSYHETKDAYRRWQMVVPAERHAIFSRIRLWDVPGEPLGKGQPVKELENGLKIADIKTGDGELVTADSKIKVHYRMVLADNQIFHNTKGKKPEVFVTGDAPLRGLAEGLVGMRVGGKRKVIMPANMAYGDQGFGLIPPGAIIVADVGLLGIVQPE